jgi:hypothetical protein
MYLEMAQASVSGMNVDNGSVQNWFEALEQNYLIAVAWKSPEFYKHPDACEVGPLKVRSFFEFEKDQQFVSWFKENKPIPGGISYGDSYQKVSAAELPELIGILENIFHEIDSTHYLKMLWRFRNSPFTEITDRLHPNFWDPSIADGLKSGNLLVRVMRTEEGTYLLKLFVPKSTPVNVNWNGVCITVALGIGKRLLHCLRNIRMEVKFKELERTSVPVD